MTDERDIELDDRPLEAIASSGPSRLQTWIYMVQVSDQLREAISVWSEETVQARGLAQRSIIGIFTAAAPKHGRPPRSSFWENPDFKQGLHDIVKEVAPDIPEFAQQAREKGEESIYLIDLRAPENVEKIPEEDVIGGFRVKNGRVDRGSYAPNASYRILGSQGLSILPVAVHNRLLEWVAEAPPEG